MSKVVNIESTPNPNALKFVVKDPILKIGVRSFKDFESSIGDSLASGLFSIGQVSSVFYMDRFVTVNKEQEANWSDLIDPICECIEDYKPKQLEEGQVPGIPFGTIDEKLSRINQVFDERIRPGLAGDGGGIEIIDFDGNTLSVAYHGACGSCPSAIGGTLNVIEKIVQAEVDPQIRVICY